jgi:threonine aldolase
MFKGIDFFSDTVTLPPEPMKQAMITAPLGDEQQGEDPTTKNLEERVAKMVGKSAAMFFPSATMCNQIAVILHCQPGDEVIGAQNNHIFNSEGGGAAFHAATQARMIDTPSGIFGAQEIENKYRASKDPHAPISRLVLVENTANYGGALAWPLAQLDEVVNSAKKLGLKTHFDGARLFNACAITKESPARLCSGFDTVTICFSKGLACPTGAILAYDAEDFTKVRRLKQVFGGAMRQSGVLAAAALYALDHLVERLPEDHKRAERLAEGLQKIPGFSTSYPQGSTNMVFFSVDPLKADPDRFFADILKQGLRVSRPQPNRFRAVTHLGISDQDVEEALAILGRVLG